MSETEELLEWVDSIPLSRKKRNLSRDFSDAVLMAEVVHYFYPRLVDLHNYDLGLKLETKIYNWKTLNKKVLKKIDCELDNETISDVANSKPGAIERVLSRLKDVITNKNTEEQQPYFEELTMKREIEEARNATDRKLLVQKIKECEEQAEVIAALEAKVARLEELIKLKDMKIAKMSRKL